MGAIESPLAERRGALRGMAAAAGLALAACASTGRDREEREEEGEAPLVTPGEDLMQEHGVNDRILLIYDEAARRIETGAELDVALVARAAGIVRRFVEDYHERNEEEFVFPRMAATEQAELVKTLRAQHERGRELTDLFLRAGSLGPSGPGLARSLRAFVRMYRPHAAREETVLFPAFRAALGRDEYEELGERLEEREHELFGEHGFEQSVEQVAAIERALGIYELAQFTA